MRRVVVVPNAVLLLILLLLSWDPHVDLLASAWSQQHQNWISNRRTNSFAKTSIYSSPSIDYHHHVTIPAAAAAAAAESSTDTNNWNSVSLDKRTNACLDLYSILDALRNHTVTILGSQLCYDRKASSAQEATRYYAMVEQISKHLEALPLRSPMDVLATLRAVEINGSPPEKEDLATFSRTIEEIIELRSFLANPLYEMTLYDNTAEQLTLPDELISTFKASFDDDNNLSADKFPVLKSLRITIETLRIRIVQIVQSLLRSDDMKEKLADR